MGGFRRPFRFRTPLPGGSVPRDFLGQGWAFPVRVGSSGDGPALQAFEANIAESIPLVLGTVPGERPYLPAFGCALHDLVFAPNEPRIRHEIEGRIRAALQRWEPRIDVQEVRATPVLGEPERLSVAIRYVVRRSNNHQNLVHLLHLRPFHRVD